LKDTSGTGSNDTAVFSFGAQLCDPSASTLGDSVLVQVVALVSNVPSNTARVPLTCTAQLSYADGPALGASASVTVAAPVLDLSKTSSTPAVGGVYGTNITYTIVLAHDPSSSSFAFNVNLNDTIPNTVSLAGKYFPSLSLLFI
jgi:hypothetical protein